jgi:hypothetical protein
MNYQILKNIIDEELQRFQRFLKKNGLIKFFRKMVKKEILVIFVTVLYQISEDL